MINVIHYIFETEQDLRLYYEPNNLYSELLLNKFPIVDVVGAIEWFEPIIDLNNAIFSNYRNKFVRHLDYRESKYLPKGTFNEILKNEQSGLINSYQRDILIDRLSIVGQRSNGFDVGVDEILGYLIKHFNSHTSICFQKHTDGLPINVTVNTTIH